MEIHSFDTKHFQFESLYSFCARFIYSPIDFFFCVSFLEILFCLFYFHSRCVSNNWHIFCFYFGFDPFHPPRNKCFQLNMFCVRFFHISIIITIATMLSSILLPIPKKKQTNKQEKNPIIINPIQTLHYFLFYSLFLFFSCKPILEHKIYFTIPN